MIALSATIKNALDLANWLDGKLIQSDWRPVPLREGVYYKGEIKYDDGETVELDDSKSKPINRLVEDSILNGGQVLVFVNTRKSTVSLAIALASIIEENLSDEEKENLKKSITSMEREQTELTSVGKKLSMCIQKGTAFHNAGLNSSQRRTVEQGFKARLIKCIVATPTLAAGVNIPARRVIIRDLWRYDPNFGMHPIPILEYKQQVGRAGRPQYDNRGEAITLAKNEEQKEQIFNNYILGDTEPIFSKLGNQAALRTHLLSAIATNFVDNTKSIYKFIDSTFYSYQSNVFALKEDIDKTIEFLLDHYFIEHINDDEYIATLFGTRTSSLYIDPLSALQLKKALENSCSRNTSSLSFLQVVCSTPDVRSLYLRRSDTWVEEKAEHHRGEFLIDPPAQSSEEYEWFLSYLKTASLVEDWIDEISEEKIISKYDIGSGDIHSIVEMVEWLLHASREFARMYNFECVPDINDLMIRVHYGCKKELINLVSLKGIGRVRARALYKEGFKTIGDLRGVPLRRIAMVKTIGEGVAKSIKRQIGESDKGEDKELSEFTVKR